MQNNLLKSARARKFWSVEKASEEVDVPTRTYKRWESGEFNPQLYHLDLLCKAFHAAPEDLGYTISQDGKVQLIVSIQVQEELPIVVDAEPSIFLPFLTHGYEKENRDWATWFGMKQAQIAVKVTLWSRHDLIYSELQTLVDQEISMFDEVKPQDTDETYSLSRRQAIVAIAALPLTLTSIQQGSMSVQAVEELLPRCTASITACWHLLKGSEFYAVEQIISTYLTSLVQLTQQPTRYQKIAARLATQCYRIKGIVALHLHDLKARESYCQQALRYSEIAGDPSLLVSALISLASTFYYHKDPMMAANIYQKALLHIDGIPPLQRSRLNVELAVVYAQQGQEREALQFLDTARNIYPEYPENDPSFLYAEFSPASMFLEDGLTHLALTQHFPNRGYDQKARDIFAQIDGQQAKSPVPERIFFEIVNQQAETALALKDQERFRVYLEQGIKGATILQSKQRRREVVDAYKKARIIWPHESSIKELSDLFF